jgi:hypothetical protein
LSAAENVGVKCRTMCCSTGSVSSRKVAAAEAHEASEKARRLKHATVRSAV